MLPDKELAGLGHGWLTLARLPSRSIKSMWVPSSLEDTEVERRSSGETALWRR